MDGAYLAGLMRHSLRRKASARFSAPFIGPLTIVSELITLGNTIAMESEGTGMTVETYSAEETFALGRRLAESAKPSRTA